MRSYQVSSEIYGGFYYSGITLIEKSMKFILFQYLGHFFTFTKNYNNLL